MIENGIDRDVLTLCYIFCQCGCIGLYIKLEAITNELSMALCHSREKFKLGFCANTLDAEERGICMQEINTLILSTYALDRDSAGRDFVRVLCVCLTFGVKVCTLCRNNR